MYAPTCFCNKNMEHGGQGRCARHTLGMIVSKHLYEFLLVQYAKHSATFPHLKEINASIL